MKYDPTWKSLDSRPWRETRDSELVRFTSRDKKVYAICLKWPGPELVLSIPKPSRATVVNMLGLEGSLKWRHVNGKLHIEVPTLSIDEVPCHHAYVFKLTNVK